MLDWGLGRCEVEVVGRYVVVTKGSSFVSRVEVVSKRRESRASEVGCVLGFINVEINFFFFWCKLD